MVTMEELLAIPSLLPANRDKELEEPKVCRLAMEVLRSISPLLMRLVSSPTLGMRPLSLIPRSAILSP